ncbi:LamG-like jellyroll fold domain-containing protein [Aureispira anguillae]|uniref:T9SS type A sorting domain-containing protein n=1 Tax=Aureispira anguillae TaxID=2864201 RepID=A0A915VJZ1_9BACT|nr:LamG-like jellyroll fold domain-containing protein [Aureispira anguillae]BDS09305.1 T9SS type A sorting domain-containing protein [Aureispira anguillae]
MNFYQFFYKNILGLIFLLTFIHPNFGQIDLDNGLELYYTLDDHAADSSSNQHHGTIIGTSPIADRYGIAGGAIEFVNNGAALNGGNILNNVFSGAGKKFTISAWIKPSALMSNNIIVAKVGDAACAENERQFMLRIQGSNQNLTFTNYSSLFSGSARRVSTYTSINDTSHWYHIVVTYDGTQTGNNGLDRVKLYIDCQEEATFLETASGSLGDIQTGAAHLGIGNYIASTGVPCAPARYFHGGIDDVRIYNRILNPSEIEALCSDTLLTAIVQQPHQEKNSTIIPIYPNPSQGLFYIADKGLDIHAFEIYDVMGHLVRQANILNVTQPLDLEDLDQGLYFIHFRNVENVYVGRNKILIKR